MERLQTITNHLVFSVEEIIQVQNTDVASTEGEANETTKNETLTITDNRTGNTITIPIKDETIRSVDLKKLGLRTYDPGYLNTASARSSISYIDGDKGILSYRGYPIEVLAERSSFLEVAYLLIFKELPTRYQKKDWEEKVMGHTYIHENLSQLMQTFRYDAHPMGIVISSLAALGTFYPDSNPALSGTGVFDDKKTVNKQILRIIGKLPTIAANAYRHRIGRPFNEPNRNLSYTENFLYMMDRLQDPSYRPHPRLAHALDVLFILHAEHELNASTAAMRHIGSTMTDPYTAISGAAAALYGPLHGGANEAVLRMLESIGSVEKIPQFLEDVKARRKKLMGFGHRVYKNYDPRAKIIRKIAYEVFSILGEEPLIEVAVALESAALTDEYFVSRKLYPNVDFYSGLIYRAMGFPTDMFPVLFVIPRAVGWLAHWVEQLKDEENRIARPRQIYTGEGIRDYTPIGGRKNEIESEVPIYTSRFSKRREANSLN